MSYYYYYYYYYFGFSFCSWRSHARILEWIVISFSSISSVSQSSLTLCHLMDFSMPGCTVHHQIPELAKFMSIESVMPPIHLILALHFLSCLHSFPASGSFPMSQFFTWGDQNIWISASAPVLPMNIKNWFPLRLTGLISLKSKGLSGVISNTIVQKL